MQISRRSLVLAGLAAPALAACSSTSEDTASGASDASDAGGSGSFPVQVEHLYGTTEIPAEPQRIATVSWVNGDSVLALGIVPVGMPLVEWGGNANSSTDWVDAKLEELGAGWDSENAPATYSETDGIDADQIAALTPDLIVAGFSGLTQEEYDQLSRIAPVIGPLAANYTASWQDVLTAVGKATGRDDQAAQVIEEVTGELSAVAEENPVLGESTFIAGTLGLADHSIALYSSGDTRPRFFTDLGMTQADVVTDNAPEDTFYFDWTAERADELVSDVFYSWAGAEETVEDFQADDLFAQIPAVAAGGLVLTTDDHATLSISSASALSVSWAIENIVPDVVAAATAAQG